MRVHYRVPLNFTWAGMDEAREALGRIDDWINRLEARAQEENVQPPIPQSGTQRPTEEFEESLDDDLNISAALGVLFENIRKTNRSLDEGKLTPAAAREWLQWWARINRVLAITGTKNGLPDEIVALAEARMQARLAKDWRKSDELRDALLAKGWEARDTKDGQKITRRSGA
jgi:cysteinyl-tRNA synthetase